MGFNGLKTSKRELDILTGALHALSAGCFSQEYVFPWSLQHALNHLVMCRRAVELTKTVAISDALTMVALPGGSTS